MFPGNAVYLLANPLPSGGGVAEIPETIETSVTRILVC